MSSFSWPSSVSSSNAALLTAKLHERWALLATEASSWPSSVSFPSAALLTAKLPEHWALLATEASSWPWPTAATAVASALVVVLVWAAYMFFSGPSYRNLPHYNPRTLAERLLRPRARGLEFVQRSRDMVVEAYDAEDFGRQTQRPYRMHTEAGEVLVLPAAWVEEVKGHPALDSTQLTHEEAHSSLPGFEPFILGDGFMKVINKHLTKALPAFTKPISEEATAALRDVFTDSEEWHEINLHHVLQIVSRLSSRIFVGKELCNNAEWIAASSDYVNSAFMLMGPLRNWPLWLRPVVSWFLPGYAELRAKLQRCRSVLAPYIAHRAWVKADAQARNSPEPFDDAIEWFAQEYHEDHSPAVSQLTLAVVAIHTTADLLTQTLLDVAQHPNIIAPLRREVTEVLEAVGWTKTAVYNLKLMDSCFKESQRVRPAMTVFFRRVALQDIPLRNGFIIKKGTKIGTNTAAMWDEALFAEPAQWDGHRFARLRGRAAGEKAATATAMASGLELTSTSARHFGFGHGRHACPGRFFAAHELKIAMAHLLLKYDWRLPDGYAPRPLVSGIMMHVDPGARFLVRRRREEIDLASLKY